MHVNIEEKMLSRLSPREYSTVAWTVRGKTIAETAKRLNVSTKSIETFRRRAYKKLHVKNIVELVKFAIRVGITHA